MRAIPVCLAALMLPFAASASDDLSGELRKADEALNHTFREVEKRLSDDAGAKGRLVAAQRAWISFRDAECTFQSSGEDGGTAAPLAIAACRTTLTTDRTEQLKAYLSCAEGDLTCPVPSE